MFKQLLAAAASVVAVATPSVATAATYEEMRDMLNRLPLLNVVEQTGTSVYYNTADTCEDTDVMGSYQTERIEGKLVVDQMNICIDNHRGNVSELLNTVRHEAVHVMQECNGGDPVYAASVHAKYASLRTKKAVAQYPLHKRAKELEAWTMAEMLTNEDIAQQLVDACEL